MLAHRLRLRPVAWEVTTTFAGHVSVSVSAHDDVCDYDDVHDYAP